MNTFLRFFYEFISIFFDGVEKIVKGFINGFVQMFNYGDYKQIISNYKGSFSGIEWIFVGLGVAFFVLLVGAILVLIFMGIRKIFRLRKEKLNQDELLDEIGELNDKVKQLMKEKDELMAMKVSQLGLSPEDENNEEAKNGENPEDGEVSTEDLDEAGNVRFPKLVRIDQEYENYKIKNYNNNFTLEELVDNLRCFAASQLHLYYEAHLLRAFIGGLACGKLIILQGISGTGKTSLAYAWGKFVKNDSCIASVQPSWRDKTELLGYFNEFTKKFNESNVLEELYLAGYDDNVHTIILDEMNIARVEYYFAEMLSILEIPQRSEWEIELVTTIWPDDPKRLDKGKLHLPGNLWYIGTINNDDSTFMVTDKVYDRAMPIAIDDKCEAFEALDTEPLKISYKYLDNTFKTAMKDNQVSEETLDKVAKLDRYVIDHFRLSFGNRIVKQLREFVPVFVGCGGTEVAGIDYVIAHKILRKFEQLNLAYIKDEIDGLISYLEELFGKDKMPECKAYLLRLKKTI